METLELNPLERAVMETALRGDHPVLDALRQQFEHAVVVDREWTGVGFFTRFSVPDSIPRSPVAVRAVDDVGAQIEGVKHGVGFVLFVKDGRLDVLEGFTYDEPWPEHIQSFSVQYDSGPERDLSKAFGPTGP